MFSYDVTLMNDNLGRSTVFYKTKHEGSIVYVIMAEYRNRKRGYEKHN